MIDIVDYKDEGFKVVVEFDKWRIAFLRYAERFSALKTLERHYLTDEAFILLEGSGTLYLKDDDENILEYIMEKNKVYNVHKNVWHHIVVSEDATVLLVENSDTSSDNTERIEYSA